ncbi:MAG: hypothetical protein SV375_17125 [Thermodesulfobacteriota bacterium]|nr:hypothetical protein [Thermodesulfobacteriota bacterium]
MDGFHGHQMGTWVWQGSGCEDSTWDLIVPKRREIEGIWVKESLNPDLFKKNQEGKISG